MAKVEAQQANPQYVFTLTKDEAQTLFEVCYRVGGSRHGSRRRHTQDILASLEELGFRPLSEVCSSGSIITFEENK